MQKLWSYVQKYQYFLKLFIKIIKKEKFKFKFLLHFLKFSGIGLKNYYIFISDIDPETNPEMILNIVNAAKQLGFFPI
jgi:hypothetical protein